MLLTHGRSAGESKAVKVSVSVASGRVSNASLGNKPQQQTSGGGNQKSMLKASRGVGNLLGKANRRPSNDSKPAGEDVAHTANDDRPTSTASTSHLLCSCIGCLCDIEYLLRSNGPATQRRFGRFHGFPDLRDSFSYRCQISSLIQDRDPSTTEAGEAEMETPQPCDIWQNPSWILRSLEIGTSYERAVGRPLHPEFGSLLLDLSLVDEANFSQALFDAPFVLVSHGTQSDPILNYGNAAALNLWKMDVETLCQMPSRLTAEPVHRDERADMLARVSRDGFIDDYAGIRIAADGSRFRISQATVWNVQSLDGSPAGQAAMFDQWHWVK